MILFFCLFLFAFCRAQPDDLLAPGMPNEPWEMVCQPTQTIGGFWSKLAESADGLKDHQMTLFCRDVGESVSVSESDCTWAEEEYVLGDNIGMKDPANCGENAYANGIKADWVDGKRKLTFKCCKAGNAEVDMEVGCHTTEAIDLFNSDVTGAKSPYEPRENCPRFAWKAIEFCDTGIKVLFCPFKVSGMEYRTDQCRELRTTDIEMCPSTPYQDWTLACQSSQTIGGFWAQKVQSGMGTDHLFTIFCRDLGSDELGVVTEEAECRWTEPFAIDTPVSMDDTTVNCDESEFASAIKGEWTGQTRKLSFFCCKPSNARMDRDLGCHSTEGTPILSAIHSGAKSPYEPRDICPRYGWSAVQTCGAELRVKFCPFRMKGQEYTDETCARVKTTEVEESEGPCTQPTPTPGPPEQCPIVPYGPCEAQCSAHADCPEMHICCYNGCENVCFEQVPCTQSKCFGKSACPSDCSAKCKKYVKMMGEEAQIERMIGWSCDALPGESKPDCCCKFRSSNPNCFDEFRRKISA